MIVFKEFWRFGSDGACFGCDFHHGVEELNKGERRFCPLGEGGGGKGGWDHGRMKNEK